VAPRDPFKKCWIFCKIEIIRVGMNRNVIMPRNRFVPEFLEGGKNDYQNAARRDTNTPK
jgi:hypothetical protein